MTKALPFTNEPTAPRRSRALPFTQAGVVRAIKAVVAAGHYVLGIKPDGTVIVGDKPIETASFVSESPQTSPAPPQRRFGERSYGGQSQFARSGDRPADDPKESLPGQKPRFGERSLDGGARSSERAAPLRAYDILTSRRRGGSWGSVVTIDDPELIEKYRAAGFTLYEEGELEEMVRKTPMGKRETAALGGFFRAQGEPVEVKGARGQITSRLVTRGYIEEAEADGNNRKHRITPAGKVEWLRLTNKNSAHQR